MRKTILSAALLAALCSVATISSAEPPANSGAAAKSPATAPSTTRPPGVDPAVKPTEPSTTRPPGVDPTVGATAKPGEPSMIDPTVSSSVKPADPSNTRPPGVDPTMPSTANQPERATLPPGQVVPRDPAGNAPRGETVSQVAHATRDFKGLDANRNGTIESSELPGDLDLTGAWATYDLDNNASLSQAEFDAYVLATAGIDTEDDED